MSNNTINVTLTPSQIKKIQLKSAQQCGTTITLKHNQLASVTNKLSLTNTQVKQFKDAIRNKKGIQITLSTAAIKKLIKPGGIFPLFASIPGIIAAAAPAIALAAALGVVSSAVAMALKKATGQGYNKGKGSKTKTKGTVYD